MNEIKKNYLLLNQKNGDIADGELLTVEEAAAKNAELEKQHSSYRWTIDESFMEGPDEPLFEEEWEEDDSFWEDENAF